METALDTAPAAQDSAPQTDAAPASDNQAAEVTWENSPITQIYNPDGSQRDGALDALKELGYGDEAGTVLRNGAGLFDSFKQHATTHKSFREKQEGTVAMPGEEASDEERSEFYGKLGALTNAEEYAKQLMPADLPEGFEMDEGLTSFVSEWAAKNPVNTPEALQGLAKQFIEHQQGQMQSYNEENTAAHQKQVDDTKMQLKTELGGDKAFSDFANGVKDFLVSDSAKSMGFQFEKGEQGLQTDNPLHAQMLNDPAALKMLSSLSNRNMPGTLPSGAAMPMSQAERSSKRAELIARNPNGWQSQADFDEYNALKNYQ